jgi:hypothetical protein
MARRSVEILFLLTRLRLTIGFHPRLKSVSMVSKRYTLASSKLSIVSSVEELVEEIR